MAVWNRNTLVPEDKFERRYVGSAVNRLLKFSQWDLKKLELWEPKGDDSMLERKVLACFMCSTI
jgi:hypothetical protein